MLDTIDDCRISNLKELSTPAEIIREYPRTDAITQTVTRSRRAQHAILHGQDDRLAVIIGPCSIHDTKAAMDYAQRLNEMRMRYSDTLEILMRVYFEKPRTTVGWKGLINDPELDGSFNINKGLRVARGLLVDINLLGLPTATEFLDMTSPQYIADLVSWAAIGARTTESQIHREMASGLSCPVGFKNGTDGNVCVALDAVGSASQPHHFMAVTKDGHAAIAATKGNDDCHIVLRGGKTPNYDAEHVEAACAEAERRSLPPAVMIDASHANSGKRHERQPAVIEDIACQIEAGETRIKGLMVESHLVAGRQDLGDGQHLTYGQSVTDACIGWETSAEVLERLDRAVKARRAQAGSPKRAQGNCEASVA
ncbi:MAG: 3-deoxy-7-phosphoheptulonate synthase [Alphaproteobacteria bacterium]